MRRACCIHESSKRNEEQPHNTFQRCQWFELVCSAVVSLNSALALSSNHAGDPTKESGNPPTSTEQHSYNMSTRQLWQFLDPCDRNYEGQCAHTQEHHAFTSPSPLLDLLEPAYCPRVLDHGRVPVRISSDIES